MTDFYNPYHFVPVKGAPRIDDLDREAFDKRLFGHVTHDRFVPDTFSGRMICRLTNAGPLFIGHERTIEATEKNPAEVSPFEIEGKPAIPSSSLRGLISSIAEAASDSAMRVLEDNQFVCRIGRNKEPKGSSHDYFRAVSPELLPSNKDRTVITIAEQLFGFVDQNKNSDAEYTKALKSRVRFSHACYDSWEDGIDKPFYLAPATLKILDKPKPPCPALYFKHKDGSGGYIKKQQLKPDDYHPQGRKMYLHQNSKNEPWKTNPQPSSPCRESDRCKQKVRITPLREGEVFYFHIDFENLSENELGLLCYSISPSDKFYHKIGMGKPIGLGTVKIEPVGIFLIDRQSRYREQDIFNANRFHAGWSTHNDELEKLPDIYYREKDEYGKIENKPNNYFDNLRNDFKKKMDKDILKAIEIIGETLQTNCSVHYPQLENRDIETENFRWFVANDKKTSGSQYLEPLNKNSNSLPPPLKR